jgi:hypothetical protein
MRLKLIYVAHALTKLDSMCRRHGAINCNLNFFNRGLASTMYEWCNIKVDSWVVQHELDDGRRRFAKNICEHIIEFQIGDGQAVESAVLLAGDHIGQFGAVSNEFAKLTDIRRWDKTALYHSAHEEITDPHGIFAIGLVAFLRLGVFGMSESNVAGCFEDVEDRDPILTGRFHADFSAIILGKPFRQLFQTFGKGRKAGLFVFNTAVGVSYTDAGIDPGLVNIQTAALAANDLEHGCSS